MNAGHDRMIIPCGEVDRWLKSADVIVVGCGIAGVCAAIAAREAGAAALVLERSSGCSGSTAVAAGHFYLGGGTAVQIACGFHDDAQALADYNRYAAAGSDPDFAKHPDWLRPLDAGPWAAFDFSFGRAVFNGFTLGGLRISASGEVLNEKGMTVPGLYAAGACSSMLAHDARDYASGISLSAGSFFGRQAGLHAALRGQSPQNDGSMSMRSRHCLAAHLASETGTWWPGS